MKRFSFECSLHCSSLTLGLLCCVLFAGIAIASALIDTSQQKLMDFKEKSQGLKNRKALPPSHQGTCVWIVCGLGGLSFTRVTSSLVLLQADGVLERPMWGDYLGDREPSISAPHSLYLSMSTERRNRSRPFQTTLPSPPAQSQTLRVRLKFRTNRQASSWFIRLGAVEPSFLSSRPSEHWGSLPSAIHQAQMCL